MKKISSASYCSVLIFIFCITGGFSQNVTRFTDRAQAMVDSTARMEPNAPPPPNRRPQNSPISSSTAMGTVVKTTFMFDDEQKVYSPSTEIRAIWITRGEYKSAEDIKKIVENCVKYNFNMLIFQVRGNGTVYYKSKIEPWAWELTSSSVSTLGKDPGWDPLQVMIDEAHKHRVQVIAWLNTFPGWTGKEDPPKDVPQLWNTHRDWFMRDSAGEIVIPKAPNAGWYRFITPTLPQVQDYVCSVYSEVVKNYNVDGIHFDYVRYPGEIGDFSYDPVSLQMFQHQYNATYTELPELWAQFRRDGVFATVAKTYHSVTAINPNIEVTAAVIGNTDWGRNKSFTSSRDWFAGGVIDITMPMTYTDDTIKFHDMNVEHIRNSKGRFVCPGILIGRNSTDPIQELNDEIQIARDLGGNGITFFSYRSFFPSNEPNERADFLLKGPFSKPAVIPPLTWKNQTK